MTTVGFDQPLYLQPSTCRRTVFWEPLTASRAKKITREDAVAEIARRYRHFVDVFERGRAR